MLPPEHKGAPRRGDVWVDGWDGRRRGEAAHWEEHEGDGVGGAGVAGEVRRRGGELSSGAGRGCGWAGPNLISPSVFCFTQQINGCSQKIKKIWPLFFAKKWCFIDQELSFLNKKKHQEFSLQFDWHSWSISSGAFLSQTAVRDDVFPIRPSA